MAAASTGRQVVHALATPSMNSGRIERVIRKRTWRPLLAPVDQVGIENVRSSNSRRCGSVAAHVGRADAQRQADTGGSSRSDTSSQQIADTAPSAERGRRSSQGPDVQSDFHPEVVSGCRSR